MARVSVSDVVVRYPIYASARQRSILSYAAHKASFGRVAREVGNITVVEALRGVSLELKDGDRLALIGRNGSGKTTMLKLCAGLLLPDQGTIKIEGPRAAILNPAAGIDFEKTGVENVEQIGRLLGLSKAVRGRLLEDVADFTELGDFMNLAVRTYSSGMVVRLLFALATSVERDILIIDELIGAGDAHFLDKAAQRVKAMFNRAKIMIIATHSDSIAMQLCNRALWLDAGRCVMEGGPGEVWDAYKHNAPPAPRPRQSTHWRTKATQNDMLDLIMIERSAIHDVWTYTPRRFDDERGSFSETFNAATLAEGLNGVAFVQDNQSHSRASGTMRGLHFQTPPMAQDKLVRVLRGSVIDVAVDLRRGSATYGRWVGERLSAQNGKQMFVPKGFAHGYVTIEPDTEVLYKVSAYYSPAHERGLLWNDAAVGIDWGIDDESVFIVDRDRGFPGLDQLPHTSDGEMLR